MSNVERNVHIRGEKKCKGERSEKEKKGERVKVREEKEGGK